MASEQLQIDIIAPRGTLFSGSGDMVIVPGDDGDMGILRGHIATIAALRPGLLWLYMGGKLAKKFFLTGGFADINDTKLVVLATAAEDIDKMDIKNVEKEIKELSDQLKSEKNESQGLIIEQKLLVAKARLEAVELSREKIYS